MKKGDLLEVRAMADQESSNEDVGIARLQVRMDQEKGYPYSGIDTDGWVHFAELTDESIAFGIDPRVGGRCPGSLALAKCVVSFAAARRLCTHVATVHQDLRCCPQPPFHFCIPKCVRYVPLCLLSCLLVSGYNGAPVCTRSLSDAGAVSAKFDVPFDAGTVGIDMQYQQYYSAGASREDSNTSARFLASLPNILTP